MADLTDFVVICPACRFVLGDTFASTTLEALEAIERHHPECRLLQAFCDFIGKRAALTVAQQRYDNARVVLDQ